MSGYLRVGLCINGKQKLCLVHRLVAIAIYDNVVQASKSMGSNTQGQNIGKCALGKRKSAFGYQWKYV